MSEISCPSCGRKLPDDAPAGLCPVCVLTAAHQPAPPVSLPSLEEIRGAFPQFEIIECIGHGGMGVVYKVRHPQLDRLLALKILLPGLHADPGFAVRFEREARVLAKLDHPNIVAVHDFGQSANFCWLTMTYVEGVNLRQAMQAEKFTPQQALAIIPPLCAALQYAHDHGILHRDIKPENILLDAAGGVKVADFGIAMLTEADPARTVLTMTGSSLGSTAYAAPEQIEQPHRVDHRADLYSLGVVFYEMLTGELPLGRFPAPSEKSASDRRLDRVVFRTLEKEPDKRYQSAAELQSGVEKASQGPGPRIMPRDPGPQREVLVLAPFRKPTANVWFIVVCVLLILTLMPFLQIAALGIAVVFLLGIPVVSIVVAWHRLWLVKKEYMVRSVGSEIIGAWLPVLIVAIATAARWTDQPHLFLKGKGDYFVNMLEGFGIVFAVGLPLFWLVSSGQPKGYGHKLRRWISLVAVLLTAALMLVAKRRDANWAFANFYGRMNLASLNTAEERIWCRQKNLRRDIGDQDNWLKDHPQPGNPVLVAVQEVSHAFGDKLFVTVNDDSEVEIGILAKNEREWCTYARAVMERLECTLPVDIAVYVRPLLNKYVDFEDGQYVATGFYEENFRWASDQKMSWLIMSGCAACGVMSAWCLAHRGWLPLAIYAATGGLMLATPAWIRNGDREASLLTGPPPPPLKREIVADFSKPVTAVQTVLDAAWAGDLEVFRHGFAAECTASLGDNGVKRVMKSLATHCTVFGTSESSFSTSHGGSRSEYVVPFHRGSQEIDKMEMRLCYEDGEWRIFQFPSQLLAPR